MDCDQTLFRLKGKPVSSLWRKTSSSKSTRFKSPSLRLLQHREIVCRRQPLLAGQNLVIADGFKNTRHFIGRRKIMRGFGDFAHHALILIIPATNDFHHQGSVRHDLILDVVRRTARGWIE